ncbi:DNA helicase II [Spiribacter sp. C176]|uniref:DNA 3'-5' helicase n=1 Tax=Spiribacter salilacus TaxID=2664894 RepID=A0A6N7QTH3_9GAMM|nr:DNA helicase II [Spiribacter salilacus]MRH78438.1 DNA helicase II [Spiribacter salilacus]
MDVSDLIDPLNAAQREAVTAPLGRALVLAGAGSGKTRVLTHRAAWLVRVEGATPFNLLAVTFTNKAAAEMRGRIEHLLDLSSSGMWVGTFHGLSHRLLRMHWQEAGLPQSFQILDSEDQRRLVKRVMRDLKVDENRWPVRQLQGFINARKDAGERPDDLDISDPYMGPMAQVYKAYESACQIAGVVDFAELMLRTVETLQNHLELLSHYRRRFRHVLVDEFQDTNGIQYQWLKLLAGPEADVFIVGDDDQSIYGWRGARVENLQRFREDYANTQVLRLEQNYRSTSNILEAANALISRNSDRLGKKLWTDGAEGEPIAVYAAFNEQDEARFVIERLLRMTEDQGLARSDFAILYRSNAQSRTFEEALLARRIPYRVYGGLRFFERAEIKDALAYLRLISNRDDSAALERIINTPTRGIGTRTIEALRLTARNEEISLWAAAQRLVQQAGVLPARAANALRGFIDLIEQLAAEIEAAPLPDQLEVMLQKSGLRGHVAKDQSERAQDRLENLDELITAARSFEQDATIEEGMDVVTAFLSHAALEAGEGQAGEWEDCVQLMTLHSAKGLEFPIVFIVGLEEGLFPHRMSTEEPGRLEEERRLAYVGITRARQQLILTHAERRRLHGRDDLGIPSRFIRELPPELIEEVRARFSVSNGASAMANSWASEANEFSLGERVQHSRFGEGIVLDCEGSGPSARIQVNFDDAGAKWLVAAYAKLERI